MERNERLMDAWLKIFDHYNREAVSCLGHAPDLDGSCEPEIVCAEIDCCHQIALEGIVVIVSWEVKLIEACVTCREARLTWIPVKSC